MSRWFRHYAGMMRDDKLVRAAVASKQPVERVLWVYGAILESAAEINDNGRYDFDAAEAAYFLRAAEDDICAVVAALTECERLADGRVVHWSDRQFQSDRSASRQAAYRERKRSQGGDGNNPETSQQESRDDEVTSPNCDTDAPETETETETKTEAAQHSEPREEERESSIAIPVALWQGKRTKEWFDQLETELREAAGLENDPADGLLDPSPIVTLIDNGYDFARDILPMARKLKGKKRIGSWRYLVPMIEEAHAANNKIGKKPQTVVADVIWITEGDPRWPAACDRAERETGKRPFAVGGRNGQAGLGWYFLPSCVPEQEKAA